MNDIKTSMRKLLSVILSITLIFSVLPVAFLQKAEAVATLRTDMRHPNGVDQYGTPCWNGSDGGLNYAKWTSSPDYLRVDYPRHIYLDISETLEEAGYYQTMTWHWGDSTDYRIIANGYLWGEKGNKNWSSGWGANWFTMETCLATTGMKRTSDRAVQPVPPATATLFYMIHGIMRMLVSGVVIPAVSLIM